MFLSSRNSGLGLGSWLVETTGPKHRVEHVTTSACERDQGLVMAFTLSDLAVVICAGLWVLERSKSGKKQGPFQHLGSSPFVWCMKSL